MTANLRARLSASVLTAALFTSVALPPVSALAQCDAHFYCPTAGSCTIVGTYSVPSGCDLDWRANDVDMQGTFNLPNNGTLVIHANSLVMDTTGPSTLTAAASQ
jgi:hypothetical protein